MPTINFTKMHGLGNDFMIIDAINQSIALSSQQIRLLADRHLGIGFDQLLLVENSDKDNIDFKYRIFNFDGTEVEQCGNGARCFARFVTEKGLSSRNPIMVETCAGIIALRLKSNHDVTVNMGAPIFLAKDIPIMTATPGSQQMINLNIADQDIQLSVLSMGNPHAVILLDNIETADLAKIGGALQNHPAFPKRVNVGFMQILDQNNIKLRVYERGVGETQACGTGACAAVVAGILRHKLDHQVTVTLRGGALDIAWQGIQDHQPAAVMMTGPTEVVFDGSITI